MEAGEGGERNGREGGGTVGCALVRLEGGELVKMVEKEEEEEKESVRDRFRRIARSAFWAIVYWW